MSWQKVILCLTVLILVAGCGNRSIGRKIDDTLLVPEVFNQIENSNSAFSDDKNRIVVSSYDGAVLLTGQVVNEQLKIQAANEALKVAGVEKLHNYLEVSDQVSKLVKSNDALITSKLKTRFLADSRIPSSSIKIITENSTVYLLGNVTRNEGKFALEVARTFTDVKRIVMLFNYNNQ